MAPCTCNFSSHETTDTWFHVWRLKKVKTLINYYFGRKEKQNQKEKNATMCFKKGQGCILPKKIIFWGKGKESDPNSLSVHASAIV